MKVESYLPCPALLPFIQAYLLIESNEGMENTILPETAIVLALRYRGTALYNDTGIQTKLPVSVITGVRKSSRKITYEKNTANLLVKFREGGAAAFFGFPLHEIAGESHSLDTFIKNSVLSELEEQLSETDENLQRISIVENFLLSIQRTIQPDFLLLDALRKISYSKGTIRINSLAESLHISRDAFEKRFRKAIGTSPKQFAATHRIRNFIEIYPQSKSLTDAAYVSGYFDQSHLIKDFRAFTGLAPKDFFKTARWC